MFPRQNKPFKFSIALPAVALTADGGHYNFLHSLLKNNTWTEVVLVNIVTDMANEGDIPAIMSLLKQVHKVHADGRPTFSRASPSIRRMMLRKSLPILCFLCSSQGRRGRRSATPSASCPPLILPSGFQAQLALYRRSVRGRKYARQGGWVEFCITPPWLSPARTTATTSH